MERNIVIVGFYDPASTREQFLGKPVWQNLADADAHDARILTDIAAPQARRAEITADASAVPLLIPDVLRLEPAGN